MLLFPPDAQIKPGMRVKFGIDPTLDRLHLGHFVPLRLARQLQDKGHPLTLVLGTFTAQLGDPSGADATRPILTEDQTHRNATKLLEIVRKILQPGFRILRNSDIFNGMSVPKFMTLAAQFTTTYMLSRDAFQKRLSENGSIALHELLVPICQGWDSVFLETEIEIGGQDQLFNFQIARQLQVWQTQKPQICLMTPIINGTDGRKMSKSLGNCIFLDEHPNDIFGKIMSVDDDVMREWFPLLTDKEMVDHPMQSKKILAKDVVAQLFDQDQATLAQENFEKVIQNKENPDEIPIVDALTILDAIQHLRNCSRSEARRLVDGGAVSLDNTVVIDSNQEVLTDQIVKVGKRHFGRIRRPLMTTRD